MKSFKAGVEGIRGWRLTDFQECIQKTDQSRMFTEAIRTQADDPSCTDSARLALIRKALRGYRATCDAPALTFIASS